MLTGVYVAVAAFEIALGKDVEENVGGVSGEGDGLGQSHIFESKRLIFFLAVINSSLVSRRRIDMYSANMR